MKNLGKILVFLTLIISLAQAGVKATLSATQIQRGDSVRLILTIDGDGADAPAIASIGKYRVEGRSQSTQIQNINGNYSKITRYEYTFTPLETIIIEPISLKINGKIEQTERIKLIVSNATPTGQTKEYDIKIVSDKKSVYVGEPFAVDMIFKRNRFKQLHDTRYTPPGTTDFWVKKQSEVQKGVQGDEEVISLRYIYSAQKSGELNISPARMNVATSRATAFQSFFSNGVQWKNLISNDLKIDVKPLPTGVSLVGDLTVTTKVDKTTLDSKEPITLLILVKGVANVEDISLEKLNLNEVVQYEEEPVVRHDLKNGEYSGVYEKKIALIADKDFTIAPISLKYFDPKDKKIKTAKSKEIKVTVNSKESEKSSKLNVQSKKEAPITKEVTVYRTAPLELFFAFLIGIIVTILAIVQPWKLLKRDKKSGGVKNEKEALMRLLPYVESNSEIAKMVDDLESKIYKGKNINIDKKKLRQMLKDL